MMSVQKAYKRCEKLIRDLGDDDQPEHSFGDHDRIMRLFQGAEHTHMHVADAM